MIRGMSRRTRALAVAVAAAALALQLTAPLPAQAPDAAPAARQVTFRLIVVSTESAARGVLERLQRGGAAEAIAAAESIDPSAARGGLIGPVVLAELRAELRDALAPLAPGQNTGVLRLPTGFGVAQLAEPTAGRRRLRSTEIAGIGAIGAVQPTVSVDGFAEANTVLQEAPKARDDWNMHPQAICDARRQSLSEMVEAMTELTASMKAAGASPPPDPVDVIQADVILGQLHAYDGRMDETIARFEQALPRAVKDFPESLAQLEEMLGIAHLHKAEMDNGLFRTPGDRCLLSPTLPALADPRGARTAIDYFMQALARRPDDGELTWLLNLRAHGRRVVSGRRAGGEPDSSRRRSPPAESIGRFTDVAAALGVDSFSSAGGVIVEDFDNDGTLEILTSNFDSCGRMQLFRRGADGRFHDEASRAGLGGRARRPEPAAGRLRQRRLQGRAGPARRLGDVAAQVAAAEQLRRHVQRPDDRERPGQPAHQHADGGVGRHRQRRLRRSVRRQREPSVAALPQPRQRHLRGHRRRRPAWRARRSPRAWRPPTSTTTATWTSTCPIWAAATSSTATTATAPSPRCPTRPACPGAERGFPTWFFDYDNDGWDDLLVSSYFLSVDETARRYLRRPPNAGTMKLYRNRGNGTFADVTAQAGLDRVYMPMGSNFGDVDNDGYPDIYLGTGSPSYAAAVGSVLLRNQQGRAFVDITASSGTGELHKGHGVAFADIDGDGDLDIVFKVGGATPGDAHAFRLFANPGHGRDWLGLDLVGTQDQPRGHRRPHRGDGARRERRGPHDPSHGVERRLVRRVAAAAAHRPRRP